MVSRAICGYALATDRAMKLYAFEQIDESLKLLPLAARRALDLAQAKVSLADWQATPHATRASLVELGCAERVDTSAVRAALGEAGLSWSFAEPFLDPDRSRVPELLEARLDERQPLTAGTWAALSALDRYALAKVASRGKAARLRAAYDELVGAAGGMSHLSPSGEVRMVDISPKPPSRRRARAESVVTMSPEAFRVLTGGAAPKGDVLASARIAGIMAAKKTSELIPLCHPLSLTRCELTMELLPTTSAVRVVASAEVFDRTGVEMEAMTAASVAALTIYDMLKGIDRSMSIGPTRLLAKSGGQSGDFERE